MKNHHSGLHSLQVNETIIETEEVEEKNASPATTPENFDMPYLKRNTPILFSTNRGLHLRLTTNTPAEVQIMTSTSSTSNETSIANSTYNITFCDLERWSTKRANTISLEDTFTVPKTTVVSSPAASASLTSTGLRMFPQTRSSVRFNGYARFDVE